MPETLYDRDSIIKNAERITNFCTEKLSKGEDFASNVKCFWASDFADTRNFTERAGDLPKNGVYIIVDKNESAFKQTGRIVRVGTHTKQNRLIKRLANHFRHDTPSLGSSVFRELVAEAKGRSEVSKYMKEKDRFFIILIPVEPTGNKENDKNLRLRLEEKIIATLSWCAFFKGGTEPSENWAGKELSKKFPCNSTYQQISEFGLWLSDGFLKPPVQEDKDCEKSFDIYDYLK